VTKTTHAISAVAELFDGRLLLKGGNGDWNLEDSLAGQLPEYHALCYELATWY